ncbi:MAG: peptidylprolyl isomerase [Bryobacteraceae bacterium]|nr:peptidylprolyl isomerase [Bryobacteraceae bacterium]
MKLPATLAVAVLLVSCSKAPENYRVEFETTKGKFVIETVREWAPKGADRFKELVRKEFYNGARFYRVRPGFVVQWGISSDPKKQNIWRTSRITDDPVKRSNARGFVSFATDGPNTRTTELFINLADNGRLDARGFSPFGKVIEGMEVVDQLYSGYGEVRGLKGTGVDSDKYEALGDSYIQQEFPKLDQIRTARLMQ